jgi:hypothetical protein
LDRRRFLRSPLINRAGAIDENNFLRNDLGAAGSNVTSPRSGLVLATHRSATVVELGIRTTPATLGCANEVPGLVLQTVALWPMHAQTVPLHELASKHGRDRAGCMLSIEAEKVADAEASSGGGDARVTDDDDDDDDDDDEDVVDDMAAVSNDDDDGLETRDEHDVAVEILAALASSSEMGFISCSK